MLFSIHCCSFFFNRFRTENGYSNSPWYNDAVGVVREYGHHFSFVQFLVFPPPKIDFRRPTPQSKLEIHTQRPSLRNKKITIIMMSLLSSQLSIFHFCLILMWKTTSNQNQANCFKRKIGRRVRFPWLVVAKWGSAESFLEPPLASPTMKSDPLRNWIYLQSDPLLGALVSR